jgi:hypothetical protein
VQDGVQCEADFLKLKELKAKELKGSAPHSFQVKIKTNAKLAL